MNNVTPLLPNTMQSVPEDQVSLRRISDLLASTYVDHRVDEDGDIYVTDGVEFPLWVAIKNDAKLIALFTYIEAEGEVPFNWSEKVNALNSSIMVPQFSHCDEVLWGRYYMTYDGGLNVRHFIKMLRRFSGAFRAAVDDLELAPNAARIDQSSAEHQ